MYRGPTEHPLAIAFGALCSIFGQGGARLMVLGSIGSYVALVAGLYRLGRLCFGPVVGVVAALLVLSRFFLENLAAQGYLDISYVALIVWAVVLEVEKPRRGTPVLVLLAAAGLLRPDAWVLAGVYWLWCCVARATTALACSYLAIAAIGPLVWVLVDLIVTGKPFYSLNSTAGLAQELGRTQGIANVIGSLWTFSVRIDKLPVVLGALAGIPLAIWLTPRRVLTPLAALVLLLGVFVLEGAAGASVIDRYLMGAAIMLLLFCAVAIGGWAMLERGTLLRRVWMGFAALLVDLRRGVGGDDAEPDQPAQHARLPRGLPQGPGRRAARAGGRARTAPLPAADAAQQQADPRRALDPRHDQPAQHRRAQPGARGRRQGLARAGTSASAAAASPSTRSAARCSSRRSSTSATTRATRSRRMATGASSPAVTTRSMPTAELPRRWAWPALAVVLAGGLGLRLWGVAQGLPYAYNADEADHFVPRAVAMFGHDLNPHYFANPPAFTYVLHYLFALAYGGKAGVHHAFALHPADVYTLARVAAAVLGVAALWLLYATGARLFGRAVGLLAAAIEAVAFLPVFYAHLALNDVPTLAPLTLSLLGSAGVLSKGRRRDYLLAGVGLGLACATKYTAGIVLVPLRRGGRRALSRRATRARRARRAARPGDLRRRGAAGLLRRQPVLAAGLRRLPPRTRAPVDAVGRIAGQARRAARRRAGLLPVDAHLGARLAARDRRARRSDRRLAARRALRLDARARAAAVPRVHGPAGPLLRALAAAGLPAAVPAGGGLRAVERRRAGAAAGAPRCARQRRRRSRRRLGAAAAARVGSPCCSRRSCWRRASSSACTRASCSRARTRAT